MGVPINSMVIFHGYVSHNQMVLVFDLVRKEVNFAEPGVHIQGGS
jgi:hypothetical protein